MKTILFQLLLVALGSAAPPLQLETRTRTPLQAAEERKIKDKDLEPATDEEIPGNVRPNLDFVEIILTPANETVKEVVTLSPITTTTEVITTTGTTTKTNPPQNEHRLSGKERKALISHLTDVDLTKVAKLVLSPRQKLALTQELEYKRLGLPPFTDPTPWQRLSREEQQQFNEKYLALSPELQEYSRVQFTSLTEERQEHAYQMFLHLDIDTLTQVINRELDRQNEAHNIFENGPVGFEEVELNINTHQEDLIEENKQQEQTVPQKVELFADTSKQSHENLDPEKTNLRKNKETVRQLEHSQNKQRQTIKTKEEVEEQRQEFQISEQQIKQLQQQVTNLDQPLPLPAVETLQDQQFQEQRTSQVEEPRKKLQLSFQHLEQIQKEIELLEQPQINKRRNQENLELQLEISSPDQEFEISTQSILEDFQPTEQQTEKSFEFHETSTIHVEQHEQPQKINKPVELSQKTSKESQSIETHTDPEEAQQENKVKQEDQTELIPEYLQNFEPTKTEQPEIITGNLPTIQEPVKQFPQLAEKDLIGEEKVLVQQTILKPQQQSQGESKTETAKEPVPKFKGFDLNNDPFERLRIQVQNFALTASEPKGLENVDVEPLENVFFNENKQIEELRKEFRLSAEKFSQNFVETKKKSEPKQHPLDPVSLEQQFKQPKEEIINPSILLQEVQPITPQFLLPTQGLEPEIKQPKLQVSKEQEFVLKQFDQQTRQALKINKKTNQLPKPSVIPTQQFQNKQNPEIFSHSSEPEKSHQEGLFLSPIRQLQKISQDFKIKAAQPTPRTRSRPIFDPRIRQQQESRKRLKLSKQAREPTPSPAELRHFQKAEAQIAKAIRLQECLNNPSLCQV